MRHADHAPVRSETDSARSSEPADRSSSDSRKPSPVVGFFVALVIALAGWGLFWLTTRDEPRAEPGPSTGGEPGVGIRLTDEEAIARVRVLTAGVGEAIRERNSSQVSSLFTTVSPAASRTIRDIRNLKKDHVFDKSQVRTTRLEILSRTDSEVRVRETRTVRICYITETGKDVTTGPAALEQVGIWILRWERENWLIHDTSLEETTVTDRSGAQCD
jgi:hypothetical protein